jgi:UDP-N-acetylmuramyl pentapeptide phosphotransferase/UDP-N-acetylglucosamine-1-phosphate transferase
LDISFIVIFCFIISLSLSMCIHILSNFHGRYSYDLLTGVQKIHKTNTPRIGGVAIFISLFFSIFLLRLKGYKFSYSGWQFIFFGMFFFIIGLIEDLTNRLTAKFRFILTFSIGALYAYTSNIFIATIGINFIDIMLYNNNYLAVFFTAFCICGLINAINIIDGLNGLASLTTIICLSALAYISNAVGDLELLLLNILLIVSVIGFFIFNWPFGKIFMGDGGAYFCGFSLAWISILLVTRNNSVSSFSCFLICIYPVTEVLFTIYRRLIKSNNLSQPDALHLHTLFYKRLKIKNILRKNSSSGLIISMLNIIPCFLGGVFYENIVYCIYFSICFILFYYFIYTKIINYKFFTKLRF